MAIKEQQISDRFAVYLGDCMEVLSKLREGAIDLSIYSPPFAGLYQYSSSPRDLSNCLDRDEFFKHYEFVVKEIHRTTKSGRMTAVHTMDIPTGNSGLDALIDFPGDVIRLHERLGFKFVARYHVWKEPLTVRNRTMTKSLSHRMLTEDSTRCSIANADQLLIFRRSGKNIIPVIHPTGLTHYVGARQIPTELHQWRNWDGDQKQNRYSHWIWRQYASAFWDDVRIDRVLPYREAREEEDEKHCHPLQLDVIERCLILWSNPGEVILTPFMGVGSEVYAALRNDRKVIGIELKSSYYHQAIKNIELAYKDRPDDQLSLNIDSSTDFKEAMGLD